MITSSMRGPNPIKFPNEFFTQMDILLWNCRGALNSDFKQRVFEMAVNRYPSIMVITETKVGGDRAAKIIEGLPFDGYFYTETIRYAGDLWLLWKKDEADVIVLSSTEQEIHATIKVCNSNSTWIISTVYASPRIMERKILWSNLSEMAKLHNLP